MSNWNEKRQRNGDLPSTTYRIETGYGKLYVHIVEDENGNPFEVFTNIGNSGGLEPGFSEAVSKVISVGLRSGVNPEYIIEALRGIQSPRVAWDNGEQINSIPDAIAVAMERWMEDKEEYIGTKPGEWKDTNSSADELFQTEDKKTPPLLDEKYVGTEEKRFQTEKENEVPTVEDIAETTGQDKEQLEKDRQAMSGDFCPDCQQYTVEKMEGCQKCIDPSCSFSEC